MFGHRDDKDQKDQDQANIPDESINNALGADNPNASDPSGAPQIPTVADPDPTADDQAWQHPGEPIDQSQSNEPPSDDSSVSDPQTISDVISPAGGFPRSTDSQASAHSNLLRPASVDAPGSVSTSDSSSNDSENRDLLDIKQSALSELEPLIDQLEQSPEEKFRTIMMMIQASDNQALVDKAYQAAHAIEDEKARAQALLDIVNEVNYFTSSSHSQES